MASAKANWSPSIPLSHILVLDFEATCDRPGRFYPQEIIEFPIVIVDLTQRHATTNCVVPTVCSNEFHKYVKPLGHPILSKFCVDLTGIQQTWVDGAADWKTVWEEAKNWISAWENQEEVRRGVKPNYAFATCGDWDLKSMLPAQMKYTFPGLTLPPEFRRWINVKLLFKNFYNCDKLHDMTGMLEIVKLPLVGRHHSGIDDTRNIARIVQKMVEDGCTMNITGQITNNVYTPVTIV